MQRFPAASDATKTMLELNPYYNQINELEERSAALRGYL